jgi:signal transduction histidine kinase
MDAVYVGHVALFALSALACFGAAIRARAITHPGTRRGLVTFFLSVGLWAGGYVGYLVVPGETLTLTLYTVGYVFAFVAVVAWLYFCAAYTGRSPRRMPYRGVAVAVVVGIIGLKLTNPLHHLAYTSVRVSEPFPHVAVQHGVVYWVLLGVSYAAIAVGFFVLLERFTVVGADTRPLVALLGLTAVPAVATIFGGTVPWLLPFMYEPPGVALFAVGTMTVYFRRFETVRFAAEAGDPAVVLDRDGRIRDYNPAAESIVPGLDGSIGDPIDSLLAAPDTGSETAIIERDRAGETRYYRVAASSLTAGGSATGRLLTINDVTDEERYRQRLERTNTQLEVLNRVVRHDIANDVTVINAWADDLGEHVDDAGREALDRIVRKSNHVMELTTVARDFVESMHDGGELQRIDLAAVLETELAAARESYPGATITVTGDLPSVHVTANDVLGSVFRNLLNNAVQHNDTESPTVTVAVRERDDAVRVRVADDGPGVPADRRSELFGRGEKGLESSGTGIGLYLVGVLVEQFDGRVWIEDNDPRGAVFVVELPTDDA